jgi:tetratricopeptide (TPR) repeat protein
LKIKRAFLAAIMCALWPGLVCAQQEQDAPYDPYRAEKSLEVGRFYLKKKNYDAAIDRFQDAIRHKPNFALPHKLIGEAYEKKKEYEKAVEFYGKYLDILPQAEDAADIRKKIESLNRKIEAARKRAARPS